MSKRYPLSRASKEYDRLIDLYPQVARLTKPHPNLNSGDAECLDMAWGVLEACSRKTGAPVAAALSAAFSDGRWVMPDDLPWIARWQACRHVYRIDPVVAGELAAQELDGDLPTAALHRMPYPIVYIDSRVPVSGPDGILWAHGFFAYLDRDPRGEDDLALVYLMEDGTRVRLSLIVEDGTTLDGCIEHVEEIDRVVADASDGLMAYRPSEGGDARARFRSCVTVSLNLLLFVISKENGAEVVYAPPKAVPGQKVGRKTNLETVETVGAKLGRAIGAARREHAYGGTYAEPKGGTKAPHVRSAHWHSYWLGKRKGRDDGRYGDELVVKWVPPIPVNEGRGDVTETIHR